MKTMFTVTILSVALALSACGSKTDGGAAALTEAEAAKVSDAQFDALRSGDIAKIDALFAKEAVVIDPMAKEIGTTPEVIHGWNQGFVDLKFDKIESVDRHIQLLGPDSFVVSGRAIGKHTAGPMNASEYRYTDIFRKQADGTYKVIHEHVSFTAPEG